MPCAGAPSPPADNLLCAAQLVAKETRRKAFDHVLLCGAARFVDPLLDALDDLGMGDVTHTF